MLKSNEEPHGSSSQDHEHPGSPPPRHRAGHHSGGRPEYARGPGAPALHHAAARHLPRLPASRGFRAAARHLSAHAGGDPPGAGRRNGGDESRVAGRTPETGAQTRVQSGGARWRLAHPVLRGSCDVAGEGLKIIWGKIRKLNSYPSSSWGRRHAKSRSSTPERENAEMAVLKTCPFHAILAAFSFLKSRPKNGLPSPRTEDPGSR